MESVQQHPEHRNGIPTAFLRDIRLQAEEVTTLRDMPVGHTYVLGTLSGPALLHWLHGTGQAYLTRLGMETCRYVGVWTIEGSGLRQRKLILVEGEICISDRRPGQSFPGRGWRDFTRIARYIYRACVSGPLLLGFPYGGKRIPGCGLLWRGEGLDRQGLTRRGLQGPGLRGQKAIVERAFGLPGRALCWPAPLTNQC